MAVHVNLDPPEVVELPTSGTAGDDVAARRAMLFEKFDRSEQGSDRVLDLEAATKESEAPREPIDSLVIQTPVGTIEFGPPAGVSLTMRIATMMGEANPNRLQSTMLRTLMSVRSVDGQKVTPITSMVEATYLANQLTDPVVDYLFLMLMDHWPPPRAGELQVLRKNKRVA